MSHTRWLLLVPFLLLIGCTTRYQVRGTEKVFADPMDLDDLVFDGKDSREQQGECRARQIAMEHQSVERYKNYSLGVIEVSDEGAINPAQKRQVMEMVEEETKNGGLLVVFVHGWHHGARVCDRDLTCFRAVLDRLQKEDDDGGSGKVVGVYIGWRGESLPYKGWNVATLWERKRVAEHIGRTTGKELFVEFNDLWRDVNQKTHKLTMVTVGHSLGGAFVFSAVKGKLTGNISDIEMKKVRSYRVVRTSGDRVEAYRRGEKAIRARFGDLLVLVNPAIEASEYVMFDKDLKDNRTAELERSDLVEEKLPYDKNEPYGPEQLPILMTVASEADTAVSRFFPPARWIQSIFTLRWKNLARKYWTGMGRYGPQVTHRLDYPKRVKEASEPPVAGDCACTKMTDFPVQIKGDLDLAATSQKLGELKFAVTERRLERGWYPNSPYLVVEASEGVIAEHSDIFNPVFVGFLGKYIDAYTKEKKQKALEEDGVARAGDDKASERRRQ